MAQGQIRKGFFFYFGLFVLALIAVFLICLVIMMFNPGSTVLWMQYFTSNSTVAITETTDGTAMPIKLETISSIDIECSYANVVVQRNNTYDDDAIYVVNKAKGFTSKMVVSTGLREYSTDEASSPRTLLQNHADEAC